MTIEQIRMPDYTDIDYIGKDLPTEIKEIIDQIGMEYGLGRGWINNDCLMSGNDLEGLEFSTGKLEFIHKFDLKVISINALSKECLLRMKVIAIDTSYSGLEFGGDFSRIKDFPDIKLLADSCKFSCNDVIKETFDYVMSPEIFFLIRYYFKNQNDLLKFNEKEFRNKVIETKGKIIFN